jgi:hypothetical protein
MGGPGATGGIITQEVFIGQMKNWGYSKCAGFIVASSPPLILLTGDATCDRSECGQWRLSGSRLEKQSQPSSPTTIVKVYNDPHNRVFHLEPVFGKHYPGGV